MMIKFQSVLKPILKLRIFAFVFQILSILLSLAQPLFIGYLLDSINKVATGGSFNTVKSISMILIVISVFDFIVFYIKDFLFSKSVSKGINLIRENTLALVLNQSLTSFEKNDKGDILNRILNDSDLYARYIISEIPQLFIIFIRIITIYIVLLNISIPLTLVVMAMFLIYLVLYFYINKLIRPYIQEERSQYSNVINSAQETVDGFATIKINAQEKYFNKRFSDILQQYLVSRINVQRYISSENGFLNFFYAIIPIAVLSIGAYFVVNGQITLGKVITFYSYTHWIIEPVYSLADLNRARQQAKAALPRLLDLCHTKKEEVGEQNISRIHSLEIKNISFSYDKVNKVLQDLSLDLKLGIKIAITGESGAGKSTLAKILLGIIKPDSGCITVNGIPLEKINLKSYLSQCSYLPQEVFLFSDSLSSNITFNNEENLMLEDIIHKFNINGIMKRKDFNVGGLSGGEKQRIGLARAIYRKPSILICDEPTSSLDENMEKLIIKSIDDYLKYNKCIFITITHRKSLLEICDLELRINGTGDVDFINLKNI